MAKFKVSENSMELWNELMAIAQEFEPSLVPILVYARQGSAKVYRYKSGKNVGKLYISLSPLDGADYHRWRLLNCGHGREMYEHVQDISQVRWLSRVSNDSPTI